jgi:hypothetical protein
LSSEALTFLMYLFASVRMIEETYFSNMAASAAPTRRPLCAPRHLTGGGRAARRQAPIHAHFGPSIACVRVAIAVRRGLRSSGFQFHRLWDLPASCLPARVARGSGCPAQAGAHVTPTDRVGVVAARGPDGRPPRSPARRRLARSESPSVVACTTCTP